MKISILGKQPQTIFQKLPGLCRLFILFRLLCQKTHFKLQERGMLRILFQQSVDQLLRHIHFPEFIMAGSLPKQYNIIKKLFLFRQKFFFSLTYSQHTVSFGNSLCIKKCIHCCLKYLIFHPDQIRMVKTVNVYKIFSSYKIRAELHLIVFFKNVIQFMEIPVFQKFIQ